MDQMTLELLSQQFDKLFENGIEFTQFAVTELATVRMVQYGLLFVAGVVAALLVYRAAKRIRTYDNSDAEFFLLVASSGEIFICSIIVLLALITIPMYGIPWFVSPEGAMISEFMSMAQ